mmetsp:Transcript_30905/g.22985  ORF Transcript_30905/g.22985 Transcript_30905/m.22985 type:complete len:89 (+) Transcript_30905:85-351(+)
MVADSRGITYPWIVANSSSVGTIIDCNLNHFITVERMIPQVCRFKSFVMGFSFFPYSKLVKRRVRVLIPEMQPWGVVDVAVLTVRGTH